MFTIYQLTIIVPPGTSRYYIGCTSQPLSMRKSQHLSQLKNGRHPNRDLQQHYYRHIGIEFSKIAEAESKSAGNRLENNTINRLRSNGALVFNIRLDSRSNLGFKHSNKTKIKIRKALSGRNTRTSDAIARTNEKLRGVPKPVHVVEASQAGLRKWRSNRENIIAVAKQNATLSTSQVRAIRTSDEKYPILAKRYSISVASISLIKRRLRYDWVP